MEFRDLVEGGFPCEREDEIATDGLGRPSSANKVDGCLDVSKVSLDASGDLIRIGL